MKKEVGSLQTKLQIPSLPKINRLSRSLWSEKIIEKLLLCVTLLGSTTVFFIMFFILSNAMPVLRASGLSFLTTGGWEEQFSAAWLAAPDQANWSFGAMELIAGTVLTTVGALILAVVLGLGCAVFLTELCPAWLRKTLEETVHLLAAIPPVIYGLIGLTVVVPLIQHQFISDELALQMIEICVLDGTSLLAGIIVLGIMITPTFVILAAEALRAVPRSYKTASLALGVSHWRTIVKIILPVARRGIMAGAILAAGIAVGEFIAVLMVSGGVAHLPSPEHGLVFFLEPVRTLAATLLLNSEVIGLATCEAALFACASIILATSILFSLLAYLIHGAGLKGGKPR
ncbi:MAG: phosphate ABC transporter permease subunit PstC [Bacillota bacterium]